jgi:hypothetical protein
VFLFILAFVLGFGTTTAWAGWDKEGKESTDYSVDGASADVRGDSFGAIRNGTCVLYSVSVEDVSIYYQLEAGIVRCSGTNPDGSTAMFSTCNARGVTYVEAGYTDTYTCDPGGRFDDATTYFGSLKRDNDSSTRFSGTIGSASNAMSGLSTGNGVHARTFAEVTSGTQCPGNSPVGHFGYFSRYNYGQGWDTITTPWQYSHHAGFGPCWSIEASNNNGGYNVD